MASLAEKRTPMAWQHRDMNYHQGGTPYQERYVPSIDYPIEKTGPPSSSDRLSHRTDKSWRTKESHPSYRDMRSSSGEHYPTSRPSYSSGRPASRLPSGDTTTSETTSMTEDDTTTEDTQMERRSHMAPNMHNQQYGYHGYNGFPDGTQPGVPYAASQAGYAPTVVSGYPGTMKSAKSVPALSMGTWNGEPCPMHGGSAPFSLPPPVMMGPMPPMVPGPLPPVQRRAASIYDMRMGAPIYGTLPNRPQISGDRRSVVGHPPPGIPPQLLPPMARPRPIVVSEDGTAEPLPVRSPPEKNGSISALMTAKMANEQTKQDKNCTKGASCVVWIIVSLIGLGVLLGLLLAFIL